MASAREESPGPVPSALGTMYSALKIRSARCGRGTSSKVAGVFVVPKAPFLGPFGETPLCGLVELRMFDRYQMQGYRGPLLGVPKCPIEKWQDGCAGRFPPAPRGSQSPSSELLWLRGPSK